MQDVLSVDQSHNTLVVCYFNTKAKRSLLSLLIHPRHSSSPFDNISSKFWGAPGLLQSRVKSGNADPMWLQADDYEPTAFHKKGRSARPSRSSSRTAGTKRKPESMMVSRLNNYTRFVCKLCSNQLSLSESQGSPPTLVDDSTGIVRLRI
jgi:hypothetical protein